MEKRVGLSVRQLVEFVLRSGSIDSTYMGMKRAWEGTRIHQQIQRRRKKETALQGLSYESEVFLTLDFPYQDFLFHVEGRADGIVTGDGYVAIEEIKSTSKPLELLTNDPDHWHWAQAKCYGYMYCHLKNLDSIQILLTYCHVETGETVEFEQDFTVNELEDFFRGIVEKYYSFAKIDYERISLRKETALTLPFPYDSYRKSQREFAVAVYRTIQQGKNLFAQAPTGTGKTISVLFPAIKGLDDGKIFYLTAKTVTRQVAEDALERMSQKGLRMTSITLAAKDKLCFRKDGGCNPVDCPYADGHFDRVNAAIIDIISNETNIRRTHIEAYAEKHRVCPFEFSLDAALFCDCIVCDYNHAYDPTAQLKRFFCEDSKAYIILGDEAHNLVERARDMFSAELRKCDFVSMRSILRKKNSGPIYRALGKIKDWFSDPDKIPTGTGKSSGGTAGFAEGKTSDRTGKSSDGTAGFAGGKTSDRMELPEEFLHMLRDFTAKADEWLAENANREGHEELLNLYFGTLDFIRISELYDSRYVFYVEKSGKDVLIKLLCLDPSHLLAQTHKKVRSTVFFSATLTPLDYFRDVLGGDSSGHGLRIPSPFPQENLCLLVDNSISTKYKDRQNSIASVTERIFAMASAKTGNYFAFFSSYAYMDSVAAVFAEKYPTVKFLAQTPNMTDEHKEDFLKDFSDQNTETLVGFVVLGGIFSEGIDLVGDRLIGAAIIGVGLPLITEERNLMSDYYQRELGDGFTYAYVYPGMNKVLQAAGRVIRRHEDRGVVLLIDSRFLSHQYKRLFPTEWSHYKKVNSGHDITDILKNFWEEPK